MCTRLCICVSVSESELHYIFRTKNAYSHFTSWTKCHRMKRRFVLILCKRTNVRTNNQSGMDRKANIWIDTFYAWIAQSGLYIQIRVVAIWICRHTNTTTHTFIYNDDDVYQRSFWVQKKCKWLISFDWQHSLTFIQCVDTLFW